MNEDEILPMWESFAAAFNYTLRHINS